MRLRRPIDPREREAAQTSGFTIIEVVLAMFILLIGMSSILGMLSFGAAMSRTATLRTFAATSIEAVMADLEENFFPLVLLPDGSEVAGEPNEFADRPIHGHTGLVYSATAVPNPDDHRNPPLEYRVDVEISWASSGTKRARTFTTILLREVPFGARLRQRFVENLTPKALAQE